MFSSLHIIPFLITLILFAGTDLLWLLSTGSLYKKYLAHLLSGNLNWIGILLFYPLYALGLYFFVIKPFDQQSSLIHLFLQGALFGAVMYGTYDLTNYATLREWPGFLVIIDICWGLLVSGFVSVVVVSLMRWILPV